MFWVDNGGIWQWQWGNIHFEELKDFFFVLVIDSTNKSWWRIFERKQIQQKYKVTFSHRWTCHFIKPHKSCFHLFIYFCHYFENINDQCWWITPFSTDRNCVSYQTKRPKKSTQVLVLSLSFVVGFFVLSFMYFSEFSVITWNFIIDVYTIWSF